MGTYSWNIPHGTRVVRHPTIADSYRAIDTYGGAIIGTVTRIRTTRTGGLWCAWLEWEERAHLPGNNSRYAWPTRREALCNLHEAWRRNDNVLLRPVAEGA